MENIFHWLIDYVHMLYGQILMIHKTPPHHYIGYTKEGKGPVVLIPGIVEKWAFMKSLGDAISKAGHPVYIVPNLGLNMQSIPQSAEYVRNVVEENDLKNVVLIAHSKGGLIGKYLLIHKNNDQRIKKLIAIATPFSGSRIAKVIPHKAFHELYTTSAIVEELGRNTDVNKNIISFYPSFDNHVLSKTGSILYGAENIKIPVKGHHKILFDKKLKEAVLESL